MNKCTSCKKNIAVVFTTKFENGKRFNEGLCLKCAYESGLSGIDSMLQNVGITDNNIDEITDKLNSVIDNAGFQSPEMMLKSMIGQLGIEGLELDDDFDLELDEDGDFDIEFFSKEISSEKGDETSESRDTDSNPNAEGKKNLPGFPFDLSKLEGTDNSMANPSDLPGDPLRRGPALRKKPEKNKRKFLEQFGSNLNKRAKDGKLDRIIGRQKELDRVIQILNRRSKNNPVLLGEPGVGKTAIAEGLALRIVDGQVPVKLRNLEVYQLDMTAMVAGTQFRGQFESRMKGVIDDASKAGNIVLVIDELHSIMGAGDAEGVMNAGNILKPALSKGDIKVLGSTTLNEYRKFIEKDSALERRFQQVIIDEPSLDDSIEILRGIKDYYENHHGVTYSDEVIKAAVILSDRYINDRYLPDKAIDLLDEAGSNANLHDQIANDLYEAKQRIEELERKSSFIENKLIEQGDVEELFGEQAMTKSALYREKEAYDKLSAEHEPVTITIEDISRVIELWTGIPVARVSENESAKLLSLNDRLRERVIGQDQAIELLADSIKRRRAGFAPKGKPASFIFVGPTGVGKTELAKTLAWALFESEDNIIRLDMSEYMESHTVSKMIGSPPGYVGFDDGGQLTEKVRRKPYSVILLDEIEKAHIDVFNILLQVLDDGRMTDSHGRVVSFENTVVIMTSNAGTSLKGHSIGFGSQDHQALEDKVDKALKDIFRPEFLNRVDETVVFKQLSPEDIRKICDLMLQDVTQSLKSHGITFLISDDAKDILAKEGYDTKFGARPLRKVITRHIEDPLTMMLLEGKLDGIIGLSVVVKDGKLDFELL